MDKLTAIETFVRVAETKSFAKAAKILGRSTTTVSRQVADLETLLGARLLLRSTRKMTLTREGQILHARYADLLGALNEAEAEALTQTARPKGRLRVSLPYSLSVGHLAAPITAFRQLYPDITLDLCLSDQKVELIEAGFDVALRVAKTLSANTVARKLADVRVVLAASSVYLAKHGIPEQFSDLSHHDCLIYTEGAMPNEWRATGPDGQERVVRVNGPIRANNGDMLRHAALAGEGIVFKPLFLIADDLRQGGLIQILPHYEALFSLYAVYPGTGRPPLKVRAFVDYLVEMIGDPPLWEEDL